MTTAYETRRVVRASPKRLFEAWLDSREHSDMTGAAAEITSKEGGPFSTLDGQITGVNVEIGSYNRIVQRWHVSLPEGGTGEFADRVVAGNRSELRRHRLSPR